MSSSTVTSAGGGGGGGSSREGTGTAKAMVADQILRPYNPLPIFSISCNNPLLLRDKNPLKWRNLPIQRRKKAKEAQLTKLPKDLLAKAATIRNTGQVLEQMPQVISSLDAHMESGLQSVPRLRTVLQLLANMETCQLNPLSHAHLPEEDPKPSNQHPEAG